MFRRAPQCGRNVDHSGEVAENAQSIVDDTFNLTLEDNTHFRLHEDQVSLENI